jgi:hypothetical protein
MDPVILQTVYFVYSAEFMRAFTIVSAAGVTTWLEPAPIIGSRHAGI